MTYALAARASISAKKVDSMNHKALRKVRVGFPYDCGVRGDRFVLSVDIAVTTC